MDASFVAIDDARISDPLAHRSEMLRNMQRSHIRRTISLPCVLLMASAMARADNQVYIDLALINKSGCTLAADWTVTVTDSGTGLARDFHPNVSIPGDNEASMNLGVLFSLKQRHSYTIEIIGHCRGDSSKGLYVVGTYLNLQNNTPPHNPSHCARRPRPAPASSVIHAT